MDILPPATPGPEAWVERRTAWLQAQREGLRAFVTAQQERLAQAEKLLTRELHRLEDELRQQSAEIQEIRASRDTLADRLPRVDPRPVERDQRPLEPVVDESLNEAKRDAERRYEMALEDIRQLKDRNAELQEQAAKARSTATKLAQQARQPGQLDWEAEKQRILAALEADGEGDDEAQRAERLKIEDVLRTTEEVIAAKDREIEELQQLLDERTRPDGDSSSAAAKQEQVVDADAMIQQERERLKGLQEQWQEKLRKTEVELALERAKLARQRAEVSDQLRAAGGQPAEASAETPVDMPVELSTCGRWLSQLGLTAADREPKRHP
jgi:hypothetical protein